MKKKDLILKVMWHNIERQKERKWYWSLNKFLDKISKMKLYLIRLQSKSSLLLTYRNTHRHTHTDTRIKSVII